MMSMLDKDEEVVLCLERGGIIIRRINKLGDFLRKLGVKNHIVEHLVYKDKLNYILIWFCSVIFFVVLFFVIHSI